MDNGLQSSYFVVSFRFQTCLCYFQMFADLLELKSPEQLMITGSEMLPACTESANGMASVSATGGTGSYTYSWSPKGGEDAVAIGLTAGEYAVTIKDINQCQVVDYIHVA